jgi:hypothetical protein
MVKVKSAAAIAEAYNRAIGSVGPAYQAGIQGATGWQEGAIQAQGVYEEKMRDPSVLARRATSIAKVSNEEWKQKALQKGASRIGPGMEASKDKRTRNFEPYRSALEGVQLPPRTADAMTNVQNRVMPIVQALVDAKKRQG